MDIKIPSWSEGMMTSLQIFVEKKTSQWPELITSVEEIGVTTAVKFDYYGRDWKLFSDGLYVYNGTFSKLLIELLLTG